MSSPSDNEKSKHTDEESFSDKESFTDEKKVNKKDRSKMKRKSKELLKSPAKVEQLKSSPGTSKKVDSNLKVGDSDSSSGEKHVGVVGDNIKQLNLNEGDKVRVSSQKDGLKSTAVQAEIGVSPRKSVVSQLEPIVESSIPRNDQIVQPPLSNEGLFINESVHIDKDLKNVSTASTSMEEVRGEVPKNSWTDPRKAEDIKADLRLLPTSSLAYKRKAFSQNEDDTLDDVSEIITDSTDIPSDSSLGPMPGSSGRRPSKEISSDVKGHEISKSLESECKVAEQISKDGHPSDILSDSNGNIACEDNGAEKNDVDGQKIGVEKQLAKCDEEHALPSNKVIDPHGSNGQNTTQRTNGKYDIGKQDIDKQKCGEQEHEQDVAGSKDVTEQRDEEAQLSLQASSEIAGEEQEEELMEQQDDLVQENSANGASESYPAELIEDPENGQNYIDEESPEDHQMDNEDQESEGQNDSSEQGDLNNESEQRSSSDFQNFAHGQYERFPIDSTTTDSGIENSLAVFGGNYQVPDNSESNEVSAPGSSGAAGFQNLQNWVERGVAGAALPPPNVEMSAASNVTEKGSPSTSYANVVARKIMKVAILETIEDHPMECAQHFAETPPEVSIVEVMPDVQIVCEDQIIDDSEILPTFDRRPDSSGINLEQSQLQNENLNVISGIRSPSNEPKSKTTCSGANGQETNPNNDIDEENNSLNSEETANNNPIPSLNPKTSRRLAKGDSDQLSSSSQEQSRESSLADMDDAIESSDSLSKESEQPLQQQTTASNLLHTLAATVSTLGKDSSLKPQRAKRARKHSENSPFKKRKDTTATCGQQAGAATGSVKRPKSDSEDESSKDDGKFKG